MLQKELHKRTWTSLVSQFLWYVLTNGSHYINSLTLERFFWQVLMKKNCLPKMCQQCLWRRFVLSNVRNPWHQVIPRMLDEASLTKETKLLQPLSLSLWLSPSTFASPDPSITTTVLQPISRALAKKLSPRHSCFAYKFWRALSWLQ